ncbi:MAG: hypothetical protein WAM73_20135 [Desulfobacterales bacterium]
MKFTHTRSGRALIHLLLTLLVVIGALAALAVGHQDLFRRIYLVDTKTVVLNGFILLLFFTGLIQLIRAVAHLGREEQQVEEFVHDKQTRRFAPEELTATSLIGRRYATIKGLHERKVPINHGAIAAITVAEESLNLSYPKFVNNVLILTGVFGTIVSLIYALIGATTVLRSNAAGEGIGVMLLGMNTALNTTATAIVCFFVFTFFYQRLADLETYVLSRVEEAVLLHIIPEFAFDSEAVNYKTERLVSELQQLVNDMKAGTDFIRSSLTGLNKYNRAFLAQFAALANRQDSQVEQDRQILGQLLKIETVLKDGFRLKDPSPK